MSAAAPPPSPPGGPELEYVGFWLRVAAALIDTVWVMALLALIGLLFYGSGILTAPGTLDPTDLAFGRLDAGSLLPDLLIAAIIVAFWRYQRATPGKMVFGARIVDAKSGSAPSLRQLIIRYIGYFISTLPFGLGLLWVGLDPRKQGWHDKMAGTVVVRPRR